jgi:hypothetical protein
MSDAHHHGYAGMNRFLKIAFAIAVLALAVLFFLFLGQYRTLQREHYLGTRSSMLTALKSRGAVTPADATFIQPWMTFDYVNHIFSLPPAYLQATIAITDARYPRLTIEEYAEDAHLSLSTLLPQLQQAVASHAPQSQ